MILHPEQRFGDLSIRVIRMVIYRPLFGRDEAGDRIPPHAVQKNWKY